MRGLRLREPAIGLLLGRVDEVGELDGVLDEEHRDVVADQVPVALSGVELGREPAHVPCQVPGALVARDGGEPDEGRRPQARLAEDVGSGDIRERRVVLEVAVRAVAAGVYHPLGDPLVIEVEDLLAEVEVLDQARAALPRPQGVLVVAHRHALRGGESRALLPRPVAGPLVGLASGCPVDLLVAVPGRPALAVRPAGGIRRVHPLRPPSSCFEKDRAPAGRCRGAAVLACGAYGAPALRPATYDGGLPRPVTASRIRSATPATGPALFTAPG